MRSENEGFFQFELHQKGLKALKNDATISQYWTGKFRIVITCLKGWEKMENSSLPDRPFCTISCLD